MRKNRSSLPGAFTPSPHPPAAPTSNSSRHGSQWWTPPFFLPCLRKQIQKKSTDNVEEFRRNFAEFCRREIWVRYESQVVAGVRLVRSCASLRSKRSHTKSFSAFWWRVNNWRDSKTRKRLLRRLELLKTPGGTPRKVGRGCAAHFPKPLTYLWPKSAIFATVFMYWPKIWYPIYDRCGWHSWTKHKLWRAFVDGLIDNDEKVAFSKKYTQFKTRVLKPYPI